MKIIAHRGVHDFYKENTMDSFLAGFLDKDIDGVELDVRETKDHEFVIIHNMLINLTSDGSGFVKEKTLKELRTYNFGTSKYPSKISTLKEVLDIAPKEKMLLVELKEEGSFENRYVDQLAKLFSQYINKNLYIVSFNRHLIDQLHKKNPHLKVGLCISNVINRSFLNHPYSFQSIHYSLLDEVDLSMETFFWTVNKVEIKNKLLEKVGDSNLQIVSDTPKDFL